jgi:ATP-binding cassette subfamily B multidrug efflux pump
MADGPSGGIHDEEVLGKAYDARLVRRLAKYVRPYWLLVAISVVLLSGDAALQLVGPALTRQVIDVDLPARAGPAIRDAAILFALSSSAASMAKPC